MESTKITKGMFIFYLTALVWIILFKFQFSISNIYHHRSINFIPFAESVVVNGKLDLDEIINNILIFIPFGVFMCMLWEQKPFMAKVIPAFLMSFILEALQFVLAVGASDITDLINNTLGGVAGIGIFYALKKVCKQKVYRAVNIISLAAAVIAAAFIALVLIVRNCM